VTEPTDPLKALIQPLTGDLVGAWGTSALNVNFTAIGGMLGGSQIISLAAATTFTLSAPAGAITPGAGPNQAQNAILAFTGTLSGNAVITLPLPGIYVVRNACTVGTNYIKFRAVGAGTSIGIPDGRNVKVWCDGSNVDFCDTPEVGSFLDIGMSTTPAWFSGCSTLPWLVCDGTVDLVSVYPALAARLGSTFGGNGITTYGRPDYRGRVGIPLDNQGIQGAAGRVTSGGSGINGTTHGAAGGAQNHTLTIPEMPAHSHGVTDPGHFHTSNLSGQNNYAVGGFRGVTDSGNFLTSTALTGISINNAGNGNAHTVMNPALVFGMRLIKT
jgi:microcystin-dependent protein